MSDRFICNMFSLCKSSHDGIFYEGRIREHEGEED
jgi:hypothetical protein